jgi:hypothetical protein
VRVLIAGGAGRLGRAVARRVCGLSSVSQLVISDLDADEAQAVVADLSGPATARALDVLDHPAMQSALAEVDLVINATGPYFRFGLAVLNEAIEAGVHYLDACDDPEPTLGMLVRNKQARDAGTLALIGMGVSPGLTNLLAVVAHAQLDSVDRLHTASNLAGVRGRALFGPDALLSARQEHWITQLSGQVSAYRHGRRELLEPLQAIELTYPGQGRRTLLRCGHPEAVTLGRHFPGLADASNLMALASRDYHGLKKLIARVDAGSLNASQAARLLAGQPLPGPGAGAALKLLFRRDGPHDALPDWFALALGKRNGRAASAAVSLHALPAGDAADLAAASLAVVLDMVAAGEVAGSGVHVPESALSPEAFFGRYLAYCEVPAPVERVEQLLDIRTDDGIQGI